MAQDLNYPRTSRYCDGREVRTLVLYGRDPDRPSFDKRLRLPVLALLGVPDDARLHECGGEIELSCAAITHAGPDAVLSFACDDADPDFLLLATPCPQLAEYCSRAGAIGAE